MNDLALESAKLGVSLYSAVKMGIPLNRLSNIITHENKQLTALNKSILSYVVEQVRKENEQQ